MPIRFRCPHCTRLLGIARRKAGSQITCPQCHSPVTVPSDEEGTSLDELEELLTPNAAGVKSPPAPEPNAFDWAQPTLPGSAPRPQPTATVPPPPAPKRTTPRGPAPRPTGTQPVPNSDERPLFEQSDVDAILGLPPGASSPDRAKAAPAAKPVSGMDVNSLDDDGALVLTAQKVTLLVVGVVVLLGVAFAAGFLIASRL